MAKLSEASIEAIRKKHPVADFDPTDLINAIEADPSVKSCCFPAGEAVFHMGQSAENVALVLKGKLKVEKLLPNGNSLTISVKTPGDLIGEAAVFAKASAYPCEIYAMEESQLLFVPRKALLSLLAQYPNMLEGFLTELSTMTYALQSKVELLSFSGIREKIAFYLSQQCRMTGNTVIKMPGSVTNFATTLNVSRTSLHREMRALEKAGAIRIGKGQIQILDAKKLAEFV